MSDTIKIDNVPKGFELTGEYRFPEIGEYYVGRPRWDTDEVVAEKADIARSGPWPILRKLEPPTPPKGWELTGEYRSPQEGDAFIAEHARKGQVMYATYNHSNCGRWILRQKYTPPKWIPEGCWLWKYEAYNLWFITKECPAIFGYKPQGGVEPDHLAALHGEIFVPPTHTDCLQVTHD